MATKKDICNDCIHYNHATRLCDEKALNEIVICDRIEHINLFAPDKQTKCDYYKSIGEL